MSPRALQRLAGVCLVALVAACGGGRETTESDELLSTTLEGFPHQVDVYAPAGAERAIVVLHGGGGDKTNVAYQLRMNNSSVAVSVSTINWDWLREHKTLLVFPQGQHLSDQPRAMTWSNRAMDSGADDVAFLQALAQWVRDRYGVRSVALMGHSMGGTMANRLWCEQPQTFDAYVSLAGPASAYFDAAGAHACAPEVVRPYLGISGDADQVLQTTLGRWADAQWSINPAVEWAAGSALLDASLLGEWAQQQRRVARACGETPVLDTPTSTVVNVTTWSHCGGTQVLQRISEATHAIDNLSDRMGESATDTTVIMDTVMTFLDAVL